MKQVTQRLRDGRIEVLEVPPPLLHPHGVLVEIRSSLVSAGTEGRKVATARQGLAGKARSRPDEVRQVIDKARRDGLAETAKTVWGRLDAPSQLGYSASGIVLEVGGRVPDLAPGDRVACGGSEAAHAELDVVPGNLCVPLPAGLDYTQGAFATLGSIALHGVRQADVRLGERVAVIGLGLVGQLVCQLLHAGGCSVAGVDLAPSLVEHALGSGAADSAFVRDSLEGASLPPEITDCDAVIVTAATPSSDPVELAARVARDRARVVIVGDVGLNVPRGPYFSKELELRLSRSYGPGRYDREYEERGLDYPIGYVRWTERRNMQAFLELVAGEKVDVRGLVTERVPLEGAAEAYERLAGQGGSPLAMLLEYGEGAATQAVPRTSIWPPKRREGGRSVGMIGAGSYSQRVLVPALRKAGFRLTAVASARGLSARAAERRFGFGRSTTPEDLLVSDDVDVAAIATRHSSHASLAAAALRNGKAVFLEKPPALNLAELDMLKDVVAENGQPLVVGFNRRHAPTAQALRRHVAARGDPVHILYRINAGPLAADHWLNDLDEGGGRLVGEGCHFVDFVCWFVGDLPERVSCLMPAEQGRPLGAAQSFAATLEFPDGSLGTVAYHCGGAQGLAKEQVEAHAGGRSGVLSNFRSLFLHDGQSASEARRPNPSKGHVEQLVHFRRLLAGEDERESASPLDTMRVTLAALRAAETARTVWPNEPHGEWERS
jgi:predicted dehydrogenase/threonine dehydrogenase-like Zn-dependent dehydrogenase